MASSCGIITQGSGYNCDVGGVVPGVDTRLILLNLEDIDVGSVTFDPTDTDKITDLPLLPGKSAYIFEQFRQSLNAQMAFVPQTLSIGFDHQITCNVFDVSYSQKKNLERLCRGKIVAIVENLDRNTDNVFEVYGYNIGMEAQTLTRIANDLESSGSWALDMKTSDNAGKEPTFPKTYWAGDYDTTKALIDSIVSGANLALSSATVETGTPTDVVLTFDKAITNASGIVLGGSTSKGISSIAGLGTTIVTVTADAAYVNGDTITIDGTFNAADGVITLFQEVVTNNVA